MTNQFSKTLQQLSCTFLPGKFTSNETVPDLYNASYAYWKKTWTDFFIKAGSGPDALNIENFMRHSIIINIHHQNNIAGSLLATLFNVSALTTYDHPCVKPFPNTVLDKLKSNGSGLCITGEYLSVHPEFRKDLVGLSLADVMVGLLMKIFVHQNIKMALAATVRAAKVDAICKNYGYAEVGSYIKIGVDCVTLFNTQESYKDHPDAQVMEMVNRYWNTRNDLTGITSTQNTTKKAA
jgi:hypothetical protein